MNTEENENSTHVIMNFPHFAYLMHTSLWEYIKIYWEGTDSKSKKSKVPETSKYNIYQAYNLTYYKNGSNSLPFPNSAFFLSDFASPHPTKRWSHLVTPGWPRDWQWPVEWDKNDSVPVLSKGLSCILSQILATTKRTSLSSTVKG